MEIAKKAALKSEFGKFRHGAVLVKGGTVRNISVNANSFCSFGERFRTQPGHATIHAEIGCILGIDKSVTDGATVYVARINKHEDYRLSKPCPMCESALRYVGIKKVVYSIDEDEIGVFKL